MKTGWSSKIMGPRDEYSGEVDGTYYFPSFSVEAQLWLLENRPDFVGLAIDTPSTDVGTST